MHIAVDLDGVVVDFIGGVLNVIEKETAVTIPKRDIKGWNFGDYGPDAALGKDWFEWLRTKDWLWAGFDAIDGAVGGIQTLRDRGHFVEAITHKPAWAEWRFSSVAPRLAAAASSWLRLRPNRSASQEALRLAE